MNLTDIKESVLYKQVFLCLFDDSYLTLYLLHSCPRTHTGVIESAEMQYRYSSQYYSFSNNSSLATLDSNFNTSVISVSKSTISSSCPTMVAVSRVEATEKFV